MRTVHACTNTRGIRSHNSAKRLGMERLETRQLLSLTAWHTFHDGSGIDPVGDADWTLIDGSGVPGSQAVLSSAGLSIGDAAHVEYLNRGLVAVRRTTSEVYVGWRMLGTDPTDVAFDLYRSTNGGEPVKLNATPLTQTTDFVDRTATLSASNQYFVRPIIQGIALAPSESYALAANSPVRQYLNVPLQIPAGGTTPSGENYTYSANDATVGDLDGDGDYEIVLKWDPSNSKDNSQSGYTGNVYVDAYQLDGTRLWRIDLGRNIRAGAHYTQMVVYDLDGNGKAEVVLKTAEATVDGVGTVIGNASADYRNASGYVLSGPEYLTVFDGQSGAAIDSIAFQPTRGSVASWGDTYGNRVDRFQATVAYLDGVHPSLVWTRGYAGPQSGLNARNEVAAFDFSGGELTLRWLFQAATNGQNPGYVGQSAHSITVGDVDGDGRDEIITGASALDDDGTLLYNTGLGHGDALHLSDMLPSRPGLELFMPHESPGSYGSAGGEFRDAATGELIFGIPATNDVGRGVAADIDPNSPGYEMWATTSGAGPRYIYSATGVPLYETPSNMFYNFVVWWDADLTRELLDGTTISEWNNPGRSNFDLDPGQGGNQQFAPHASANNGTKSTPSLVADLLGDWREEVIWRRSDSTALEIFTTVIPANNRFYTLMHDPQYRAAIAWQNSGYNQPPHPSFFLGAGMDDPPVPRIRVVSAHPSAAGDFDLDRDVDGDDLAIWEQTLGVAQSQGYLPGDADGDQVVGGSDFLAWQRALDPTGVAQALAASPLAESSFTPVDSLSAVAREAVFTRLAGARISADVSISHHDFTLPAERASSEPSPVAWPTTPPGDRPAAVPLLPPLRSAPEVRSQLAERTGKVGDRLEFHSLRSRG
jgi:rhamnogalacturonan endolyase